MILKGGNTLDFPRESQKWFYQPYAFPGFLGIPGIPRFLSQKPIRILGFSGVLTGLDMPEYQDSQEFQEFQGFQSPKTHQNPKSDFTSLTLFTHPSKTIRIPKVILPALRFLSSKTRQNRQNRQTRENRKNRRFLGFWWVFGFLTDSGGFDGSVKIPKFLQKPSILMKKRGFLGFSRIFIFSNFFFENILFFWKNERKIDWK